MTRSGWRRSAALAACCLLLAGLLASCARQPTREERSRVVVVLFDASGSTDAPATRALYREDFTGIVEMLQGGDTLVADIITGNSQATASFPVRAVLPRYDPLQENKLAYDARRRRTLDDVNVQAKRLLATTDEKPHTDLLGAMQLVAKVFGNAAYRQGTVKVLIVFSDMIQQMPEYDFTTEKLTPERIEAIIAAERDGGRLPDLRGVHVWVIGAARSAAGQGLPPQQIGRIQAFWIAYFTACGAAIDNSQYVPRLAAFALPDA